MGVVCFASCVSFMVRKATESYEGKRRRRICEVMSASLQAEEGEGSVQTDRKPSHWLGKKHREDTKRKISMANKGNVPWNKGRKHSEETRRKIAERTRAAMSRPEMREKMRQLNVGRKHDVETKRKIKVKVQESNAIKALRNGAKQKKGRVQIPSFVSKYTSGPVPFNYEPELMQKVNQYIKEKLRNPDFIAELSAVYEGPPSNYGEREETRTSSPPSLLHVRGVRVRSS